ncbi:MAG: antibiotic resistance protein MarC [Elusimicrobia bacterium CG11_big_fil_rev_8_21_14_0_20_64_6]|nr:MAG: antibiotic resistance protein MarC [Elusimicrobia bacterium CG11_big_fil_rev_8_21_14_0_20_64_6]
MLEYAFLTFGSLFAIVDPFAAVPTFLALTSNDSSEQRHRMARTACLTCAGVMAIFALLGPSIFRLFGITLAAFQIAGGLVLLLSSLDMIRAQKSPMRETPEEFAEGMSKDDIAITPLAVPLLAGPGAITTSIVLSGRAANLPQKLIFFVLIAAVALISYWVLVLAADSAKKLSPTILNIITRLMGLLLAAIGVQFILSALKLG